MLYRNNATVKYFVFVLELNHSRFLNFFFSARTFKFNFTSVRASFVRNAFSTLVRARGLYDPHDTAGINLKRDQYLHNTYHMFIQMCLYVQSPAGTCTTCFNMFLCIFCTVYVYGFHMILWTNSDYSLHGINQFIFVLETRCIFFVTRIGYLNIV